MSEIILALERYRNLDISKEELLKEANQDLRTLRIQKPVEISSSDIVVLLECFKQGKINVNQLLDWVNTIWFTDLFDYNVSQGDSIASVMNELEEVDEDIEKISLQNIEKYINALRNNIEV